MTEQQMSYRLNSKRKTIKMLMTVVIIFAVCWLPIHSFHIMNDFFYFKSQPPVGYNTYLLCHWLAFSSVCWNPFIYFGLNQYYRQGLRKIFLRQNSANVSENNSLAMNSRSTVLLSRTNSRTSERKLNITLSFTKNNNKNSVKAMNTSLLDQIKDQSSHRNCCPLNKNSFITRCCSHKSLKDGNSITKSSKI